MDTRYCTALLVLALAMGACSKPSPSAEPAAPAKQEMAQETAKMATQAGKQADTQAQPASAQPTAALVNKVWVVAESAQVATGSMRVFLADGALVMAGPGGSPAFGSWHYQDGKFTLTEEGQTYATEILELSPNSLHIRIHNPGQAVEMRLVSAPQPALSPSAAQPVTTGGQA